MSWTYCPKFFWTNLITAERVHARRQRKHKKFRIPQCCHLLVGSEKKSSMHKHIFLIYYYLVKHQNSRAMPWLVLKLWWITFPHFQYATTHHVVQYKYIAWCKNNMRIIFGEPLNTLIMYEYYNKIFNESGFLQCIWNIFLWSKK